MNTQLLTTDKGSTDATVELLSETDLQQIGGADASWLEDAADFINGVIDGWNKK